MTTIEERAIRAAERRLPGGLTGAIDRMCAATGDGAMTLTAAQLEVLTLLACGVETVRDLCTARGLSVRSTNAIAEHTAALERRGLVERVRPRDGTAYRYAPWVLTSAGWRTLGPCECVANVLTDTVHMVNAALEGAMGEVTRQGGGLGHIAVEAIGAGKRDAIAHMRNVWGVPALTTADGGVVPQAVAPPRPLRFCPWCGWRLW